MEGRAGASAEVFAKAAFERILARHPRPDELKLSREFLETRTQHSSATQACEALVTVLFNHNDFITVR